MSPSESSELADLVRRLRFAAGLTQEALAERSGLSVRQIGDLERGLRKLPRLESIRMLGTGLGLSGAQQRDLFEAARPELREPTPRISDADHSVHRPLASLPIPSSPLFGRDREVAELTALLSTSDSRLLTLSGPGGVGKTRLALDVTKQVAPMFRHGVVFVDCSPVSDVELVPSTIAQALGIRGSIHHPYGQSLAAALNGRHVLMLIDNFEHVIDAAPVVGEMLAHAPTVHVLATSREALRLRDEIIVPIEPLALPEEHHSEDAEKLLSVASVALLNYVARKTAPGFTVTSSNAQDIASLCRRLDGLPLALELVAPRLSIFSSNEVLHNLSKGRPLLTAGGRDRPHRHQTMRSAIFWSLDHVTQEEKEIFETLSVFSGTFTLEAALHVARRRSGTSDAQAFRTILSLADKNLVRTITQGGTTRFGMLETVRDIAHELLGESGDGHKVQRTHAEFYARHIERYRVRKWSERCTPTEDLSLDEGNFNAALEWTIQRGDVDLGLRLGNALAVELWAPKVRFRDQRYWLLRLVELSGPGADSRRAYAFVSLGFAHFHLADGQAARSCAERAQVLATRSGNLGATAWSLNLIGMLHLDQRSLDEATNCFRQALPIARLVGEPQVILATLNNLSVATALIGQLDEASTFIQECLEICQESEDTMALLDAMLIQSFVLQQQCEVRAAAGIILDILRSSLKMNFEPHLAITLDECAVFAASMNMFAQTVRLHSAAKRLQEWSGSPVRHFDEVAFLNAWEKARHTLSDQAFTEAWNAGRDLTREQLVTEAESVLAKVSASVA